MAHIPQGMDPNATGESSGGNFAPSYLFEQGATVNFKVHKVEHKAKRREFKAVNLLLNDCELWSFQLIIEDNIGNSNFIFADIIKDGRAWHILDKNQKPWVQNQFINLCTGMGLRRSGDPVQINPAWYTDIRYFQGVQGICSVGQEMARGGQRAGTMINTFGWFTENPGPLQTALAPQQQQGQQLQSAAPINQSTPPPAQAAPPTNPTQQPAPSPPAQQAEDPIDDIPF